MKPQYGEFAMLDLGNPGYTYVQVRDVIPFSIGDIGYLVYVESQTGNVPESCKDRTVYKNRFVLTKEEWEDAKRYDYDGYSTR